MAYFPFQPGQQPMSSSQGVVIASNQSPVSVAGTINIGNNASVSGTVGASVIGLTPVSVSNFPTTQNVSGSVAAWLQSTNASVITVGTAAANQSVSGTVGASIIGQLPAGTAVLGSVAALQGTMPWTIGSIYGNISGSVAATITNTTINVSGSVVGFQGTNPWVIGSIVGTYGEDIPSTAADKGLFTLGIRNDTVASLVGTDLDYTGWSTDSAGRHLVKPFAAEESRLSTISSTVSTSVAALFPSVIGLRNYVTDVMVVNTGSVSTLVTFKDGSTSILGFTIAPAGGGSNINGMAFPMRTAPAQDFTYTATTPSSVLYISAYGYKAP